MSYFDEMLAYFLASPFMGLCLTLFWFNVGVWIKNKTKKDVLNPLLTALIGICVTLWVFNIPVASYEKGAVHITLLLSPATVALGLIVYQKRDILKDYFWVVVLSTGIGALASVGTIYALCKVLQLDEIFFRSLFAKSITTPLALAVAESLNGISSLTVLAVVITGIIGAAFSPLWIKWLGITDEAVAGLAIGTSSHALGTSKAIELGKVQGAMSSVAICTTGLVTVLFSMFFL